MDVLVQLLYSAAGAAASTLVLLSTGYALEVLMSREDATNIALLVSAAINFVLQKRIFYGRRHFTGITLWKYLIATGVIVFANNIGHSFMLRHESEYKSRLPSELQSYYATVAKGVVAVFVFLVISFPIRKLWVFT